MSKPTFAERCQIAQQLLPYAQYRAMLTALHAEMLQALAEQPAQQEPVAWMQDSIELYVQDRPSEYYTIPLYTSPQPAQQNSPWCMKMNGCKTKCEDCPDEVAEQPAQQATDYAWPTIADYEKEVGFEVNDAFKAAWTMARTTNDLFKQMGENT